MDIEIKNESAVISSCEQCLNSYIPQLNSEISSMTSTLNKIKAAWSSTGIDQESYIQELSKQLNNLTTLETAMKQLLTTVYNYANNAQQIRSRTIDAAIGDSYSNYDVSTGYVSASNAVNNIDPLTLNTEYINEDSSIKSFAVVNDDGTVETIVDSKGTSLSDVAQQSGVSYDDIAVDIGKNGESQAWVSATDLLS